MKCIIFAGGKGSRIRTDEDLMVADDLLENNFIRREPIR